MKNFKRKQILLLAIAVGLIVVTFGSFRAYSRKCIPSPVLTGQTVAEWHDASYYQYPKIAPLPPWQLVVDIPYSEEQSPEYIAAGQGIRSFVLRSGKELWMRNGQYGNKILRYDISTNQWKTYDQIGDVKLVPEYLFVTRSDTVWGFGITPWDERSQADLPMLSRYNPETDRFEFVEDTNHLLTNASYPGRVAEDHNGNLWIIVYDSIYLWDGQSSLYHFDVSTQQAVLHLTAPQISTIYSLAVAPDNTVWISDGETGQVFRYNPLEKTLEPFQQVNENIDRTPLGNLNLFFDQSGNLWVEDRGWIEFGTPGEGTWHPVQRSKSFVSIEKNDANQYLWARPSAVYQTSNGLFWFSSLAGMVQADIDKGTWCRFTTEPSPIVEDNKHSLWMAISGRLYRYKSGL